MRLFLLFSVCLLALPAQGQNVSRGNHLHERCSSSAGFDSGYCIGFIHGVVESIAMYQASITAKIVCVPPEAALGQIKDIAVNFIASKPELRHGHSVAMVWEALKAAFPCR
jgi:hypothetical protein